MRDSGIEVVCQVGECPEALELHPRRVGDVAEHADEDEGAIALRGKAWGCNAPVEAPRGIRAVLGLVVVLRFGIRGRW